MTADWVLWSSTLFAHANTCSLVTFVLPSDLVSSLIISAKISVSLNPHINFSFNCLSIGIKLSYTVKQNIIHIPRQVFAISILKMLLQVWGKKLYLSIWCQNMAPKCRIGEGRGGTPGRTILTQRSCCMTLSWRGGPGDCGRGVSRGITVLFIFLQLHSTAANQSLPIHSLTLSFPCLTNFLKWN